MMSFWVVPWSARRVHAVLLGDDDVQRQQPRRRRVDRHRRVHLVERDAVEQRVHVALVGDRDADLADLAARELVVGVVAGLGRQVEGDRQPGLPLGEVRAVQLVGLLGGRVARVRPHHPRAVALGQAVLRVYGGRIVWSAAGCPSHRRDRRPPPRPPARHLLLRARRRARRPRSGVLASHAAGGARRRAAASDPADPHPLRPRRRHRARSCAAGPTSRSGSTSAARRTSSTPAA